MKSVTLITVAGRAKTHLRPPAAHSHRNSRTLPATQTAAIAAR